MSSQLIITDATTGNTVLTCDVVLNIELDTDAANVANINALIANPNLVTMSIVGNSIPQTANNTVMVAQISLSQVYPDNAVVQNGNIIIGTI